jgi:hypothetical protein
MLEKWAWQKATRASLLLLLSMHFTLNCLVVFFKCKSRSRVCVYTLTAIGFLKIPSTTTASVGCQTDYIYCSTFLHEDVSIIVVL